MKCTNITIDHCEMFYNRRNNISIIDVDGLLIDNCYLYDAYGHAPMCAVYIEPNWNSRGRGQNDRNYEEEICRNITIQNTYMASYHRINDTDYGWSFMSHQNPYDNNYVTVDGLKILNCTCYGWFGNYSCSRRAGSFDHTGTVFYGTYRNRDENWRTPY